MQLYVWTHFAPDWSEGVAFALAETIEEARALIMLSITETSRERLTPELASDPDIITGEPFGFSLEGGA